MNELKFTIAIYLFAWSYKLVKSQLNHRSLGYYHELTAQLLRNGDELFGDTDNG